MALINLVKGPENIIAAANRVVIFLKNKELVNQFIISLENITISSEFIRSKKYSTAHKIMY